MFITILSNLGVVDMRGEGVVVFRGEGIVAIVRGEGVDCVREEGECCIVPSGVCVIILIKEKNMFKSNSIMILKNLPQAIKNSNKNII